MSFQEGNWVYSTNEEIFRSDEYPSKEEAIQAAKEDLTWDGYTPAFYVGQIKFVPLPLGVDIDGMLENISVSVYDEVGEVAEDYLNDVTKEHRSELEEKVNEVVQEWMEKHKYKPNFFSVTNVEKIDAEGWINNG